MTSAYWLVVPDDSPANRSTRWLIIECAPGDDHGTIVARFANPTSAARAIEALAAEGDVILSAVYDPDMEPF